MSEAGPCRATGVVFSLRHLLAFTALVALGVALGMAFVKKQSLLQRRDDLLSRSNRLVVNNKYEIGSTSLPNPAANFNSWQVYVPNDQDYELRLGIGDVFNDGIPPIVSRVRLAAGEHRVTFYTGDTPGKEFLYVVYVDGLQVLEKTMGREWMPNGWSSSRSIYRTSEPHQLDARSYEPNVNFGADHFINSNSDAYVTRPGYRLWIDPAYRTDRLSSPYVSLLEVPESTYLGIGLRDGLRFSIPQEYRWIFEQPYLGSHFDLFEIETAYISSSNAIFSPQSQAFDSWLVVPQAENSVLVHAITNSEEIDLQPVIEMEWDAEKLDEIKLRLADLPSNDRIVRWRLRIHEGSYHLWRELQLGNQPRLTPSDALKSNKIVDENLATQSTRSLFLKLANDENEDIQLHWQTNENLPLQIVSRNDNRYTGLRLYEGLPVTFSVDIPASLKPNLAVEVLAKHPNDAELAFPGGPVFHVIDIYLDGVERDWITLSVKRRE